MQTNNKLFDDIAALLTNAAGAAKGAPGGARSHRILR